MPEPMLQNILENPADDGPRLVAADWLEEHGACERAEFIRIQISFATCRMCNKKDGSKRNDGYSANCGRCSSRSKVRRRADELLAANEADWVRQELGLSLGVKIYQSELNQFYRDIKFHWHRGWPSQIECRIAEWCGDPCQRCEGDGKIHDADFSDGDSDNAMFIMQETLRVCQSCHGTDRTPGLGAVLLRRAPIELVVVTDREPADLSHSPLAMRNGLKFVLGNESTRPVEGRFRESDQHFVPDDIWKLLSGVTFTDPHVSHRTWCWFESYDAARAALSDALIKLAREQMEPATARR